MCQGKLKTNNAAYGHQHIFMTVHVVGDSGCIDVWKITNDYMYVGFFLSFFLSIFVL